jgi:uncharacterized C2H2 Zn-finger protein
MENICRLCAEKSLSLVPIFSFDKNRLISDMIILICPIKVSIDEPKIPSHICRECLKIIKSAHELREKSVRNDYKFRNVETTPLLTVIIKEEKEWQNSEVDDTTIVDTHFESDFSNDNDDDDDDDDDDDPDFSMPKMAEKDETKQKKRIKSSTVRDENGHFECSECNEKFQYESNLQVHFRKSHSSKTKTSSSVKKQSKSITCEICGLLIAQSNNYKRHLIQYHDSSLAYGCSLCTYRFSSAVKLESHGIKAHSVPNIKKLDDEYVDNQKNTVVECDLCGGKYIDLKSLSLHMKKSHEKWTRPSTRPYSNLPNKFPCSHCDKIHSTRSNLLRHISLSHPEISPHPCSHCPEGFRSQRLLFTHLEKAHDIVPSAVIESRVTLSQEPLICHFCSEDCTTSKYKLERHLLMKHEEQLENVHECDTCQKKFVYEDSFKQHLAWHQRKNSQKNFEFPCMHCNKRFPNEEKLERHS